VFSKVVPPSGLIVSLLSYQLLYAPVAGDIVFRGLDNGSVVCAPDCATDDYICDRGAGPYLLAPVISAIRLS